MYPDPNLSPGKRSGAEEKHPLSCCGLSKARSWVFLGARETRSESSPQMLSWVTDKRQEVSLAV